MTGLSRTTAAVPAASERSVVAFPLRRASTGDERAVKANRATAMAACAIRLPSYGSADGLV